MNGDPMNLPPLYKYLDVQGARRTLQKRMFKHAKPSTFNDTEDLTIRSLFPEDDETALKILQEGLVDVLMKHVDDPPTTPIISMRRTILALQAIFKVRPGMAKIIKEQIAKGEAPSMLTLENLKNLTLNYVAQINLYMQNWRIPCVSTLKDSEHMWSDYAKDHQGIGLRIVPNLEKDSKFQKFEAVTYRDKRPALFESTAQYMKDSLFGDQDDRMKKSLHTIVYSKTLKWKAENEYRLAIPLGMGEQDWNLLPYHPDEIVELYLGAKATDDFKAEIVGLAQAVNPQMKMFDMTVGADGKLLSQPRS
jgi:hypothetical protein